MRWARRSRDAFDGGGAHAEGAAIFGIQQGALDQTLRADSAGALIDIGFDGYAVGGLAVGETESERVHTLDVLAPHLPRLKPRYLMGVGRPQDIVAAVARGVDVTPAAIVARALEAGDAASLRALDLFIACYGEAAGNLALSVIARGGVYIAGGIAPKIFRRIAQGGFISAFNAKGSHSAVVQQMPVTVVLNERLGTLGCALVATMD